MKIFIICTSMLLLHAAVTNAQDIEANLSGNTTTQGFTVKSYAGTPLLTVRGDGNIGLGILNPDVLLHVAGQVKITGGTPGTGKVLTSDANGLATWETLASGGMTLDQAYDQGGSGAGRTITADAGAVVVAGVDGFLVTAGTTMQGTIPADGAGARMMWYPRKRAFRAGYAGGTQWDDVNIGYYSTAMGYSTIASGENSTAMGYLTVASGEFSTAMGRFASTGGHTGSMAISDASASTHLTNTAANQWMARFAGGIRFYTNAAATTGVYMNGNTSGWTNFCDRNKKENFTAIDGEAILARLRAVHVSEWNYIGTETSIRYIGPMAQDFWQAFHLGGTDSLGINSVSIDGVNMAAIQALEKRTAEVKAMKEEIASLKEKVSSLENAQAQYAAQAAEVRQLRNDFAALKALLMQKSTVGNGNHASLDPGK